MTWYIVAAGWFAVSVIVGVLAGRFLARVMKVSPSGSLRPSPGLPPPEGENTP